MAFPERVRELSAPWLSAALVVCYVALGSLLHFVVFPEPSPAPDDRPRSGSEVHLPDGSTFIYRITALESEGRLFEADWTGPPGAGIARHTHPSQAVDFEISQGTLRVVADGKESFYGPGEQLTISAGVVHGWENASDEIARGVFRIRPAGMSDFVFVQLDRAFEDKASAPATALQTIILIGTHGKHTAWPIEVLRHGVAFRRMGTTRESSSLDLMRR